MLRAAVLLAIMGCGRVDFRAVDAASDGAPDAANPPTHRYRLANSYADDLGGPPLDPLGGTFDSSGYRFATNQGLAVANAMPIDAYTIDIIVAFDDLTAWRKLVDFKGLATDDGCYAENGKLAFVEAASAMNFVESAPVLVAAMPAELTLTRDTSGTIVGYIGHQRQFTLVDSLGAGTFTAEFAAANFAVDDHATNQSEAGSGVIREIRIWSTALTDAQITAL